MQEYEHEFRVLDTETIQDPDTLIAALADLFQAQKVVQKALAMATLLLLHHLGEADDPGSGVREDTIRSLTEFAAMVLEQSKVDRMSDALRDLLEAKE